MKTTRLIFFFSLTILTIYFTTLSSCSKEYSCEGCFAKDSISPINTLPSDTTIFIDTAKIDTTLKLTACSNCDSTQPLVLNTWSIRTNGSYVCGTVDYSWFDTEKYSFDFSGYFKCSRDTGFRIVAFFYPLKFNADRFNVSTTNQSLIMQDRVNYMNPWAGYVFRTDGTTPFHTIKVIVDTFHNATKLMVGRFYGYAYTKNNEKTFVDGKFKFIVR